MTTESILQLGAGKFLRAFLDRFVQNANDAGQDVGQIVVVQSTPGERADLINRQPDGFHVLVRGYDDGEVVDRVETIRSIRRGLLATTQWPEVLEVARSADLKYVVSNATEAGYAVDPADTLEAQPPKSMPAKLTAILWARFQAKGTPLVLLPCELIERNASKLCGLVMEQAKLWKLPDDFRNWLEHACWWLNNLVDCIVTNAPKDHALSETDRLMVTAEPYALFAIERPARGEPPLFTHPKIHVVKEVAPYFLRKVRMLNGVHSAMAAKFLPLGFRTVQDVLKDRDAVRWVRGLLFEEIVPTLVGRADDIVEFADQTYDRLRNPFSAHLLSDIAMHHTEKVRVRLQPTFMEYEALYTKVPKRLSEVMAAKIVPPSR